VQLEYAKPDPNLHTRLFAKMPWDPNAPEGTYPGVPQSTPKEYRYNCSNGNGDAMECRVSLDVAHLFPFPIPKCYFADISRESTNWLLLAECLPFGKRGKVVNGKVVEEIEREPYDMLPVCGKYQDFLLDDPKAIYVQIFRTLAQLAGWDQQGRFDTILGPITKFNPEGYIAHHKATSKPRKWKKKRKESMQSGAMRSLEPAIEFVTSICPYLFSAAGKDKKNIAKFQEDMMYMAPYTPDIQFYLGNSSDFIGVAHWNLQADNAFFWADENGDLDCGVIDWSGFSRPPNFVQSFMGCLSGAESDVLYDIEEDCMKAFCDEYERYGGPHIDWEELQLRWHLVYILCATDTCRWIEQDVLREMPKEEWKPIRSRLDEKFMSTWNVRCRATTFINLLEYWPRRNFNKIFKDWQARNPDYVTEYTDN
jgi:hypothetical protein